MKNKSNVIKIFITITLIVTVITSLIFGIKGQVLQALFYNLIYAAVFSGINLLYFYNINRILSWEKKPKQTLFLSLIGVIPLNIGIFYFLNFFFSYFVHGESFKKATQIDSYFSYVFVVIFSLSIALFILMLIFFRMVSEEKIKSEKLKTETEKSRFNSLKSQLNPHFLFNNLNVLTALIHENPTKAEEFTIQLADIYRYLLNTENKELVSLKEELAFAEKYMQLLNLRFENQLVYSFPENLTNNKYHIPPLSLQLLLENIIKHNMFSEEKPIEIQIFKEGKYLGIKNHLRKRPHSNNSSQKGLYNLIQRYKLITSDPVLITEDEDFFIVKIPLL